jgi:hypothetical protein
MQKSQLTFLYENIHSISYEERDYGWPKKPATGLLAIPPYFSNIIII